MLLDREASGQGRIELAPSRNRVRAWEGMDMREKSLTEMAL